MHVSRVVGLSCTAEGNNFHLLKLNRVEVWKKCYGANTAVVMPTILYDGKGGLVGVTQ